MFNALKGKTVLVTGHTGFKGSWLTAWLQKIGAEVVGFSLPDTCSPSHWECLNLDIKEFRGDIRDAHTIRNAVDESAPDFIFHLAAQPLVRYSYHFPIETWETNVMGTVNLLEAAKHCESVKAVLVSTTDKVYANHEWCWGYREVDRLGGHDPYSASKAATEVVIDSYQKTCSEFVLASARAGNVIGGGDWSEDRLIPDLVKQYPAALKIRSPKSTRPWQHVLDCLSGYLSLAEHLVNGQGSGAWNFGPNMEANQTVEYVLKLFQSCWSKVSWEVSKNAADPHEANLLYLDSSKAHTMLKWSPKLQLDRAIQMTVDWYEAWLEHKKVITFKQLDAYLGQTVGAPL